MSVDQSILEVDSVSKIFGSVRALDDLSMQFKSGEVHGLVGSNGSGKSTLVKIMCGVEKPSSGSLVWMGKRRSSMGSPSEASSLGIRVVHQEAPLIDKLSVLESVATFQGYGTTGLRRIPWRRLRKEVRELLDRMEIHVGVDELCAYVGQSDRAGLALAIAMGNYVSDEMSSSGRLLILDEVTASIPERETEQHLNRIRKVADSGVAVVMVTHRLAELRIADDVTVLREGRVAYHQGDGARRTVADLVKEMISPSVRQEGPATTSENEGSVRPVVRLWGDLGQGVNADEVDTESSKRRALRLENIEGSDLRGLSLDVNRGEIVGFVGLEESGITELPRVLAGSLQRRTGSIVVGERSISRKSSPREFIGAGLTTAPSDRLRQGGVATLSMEENVILPALGKYWHKRAKRRRVVNAVIDAFDVRPRIPATLFGGLSGGNQQKVLLGKWLLMRPLVLVLDDPTYGVDPAAREYIFAAMLDAARSGVAVLFFSTEPAQLTRVCGRVEVIQEGIIKTELSGDTLTPEALMEWNYA